MHIILFSAQYLRSIWNDDFVSYCENEDERVKSVLETWANREQLKESSSESALLERFFIKIWGYSFSGVEDTKTYSVYPQFPVKGAGQTGSVGSADVALGYWGKEALNIPQVLGEFKDINSGLDVEQRRKGNTRSPVKQCADYLKASRAALWGNEAVQPVWGLVTDMNEFRLYHFRSIPQEYQRFVISTKPNDQSVSLISDGEEAQFQRFLFYRMFSKEWLLAERGKSDLEKLLDEQWTKEEELENEFYAEYRAYREHLYETIKKVNTDYQGTPGQLVRLTQRLLDRLIFLLYAEDIGTQLGVKTNFLRDFLIDRAQNQFFDPEGNDVWSSIKSLFRVLNTGGTLGNTKFFQFNGGLFRELPELEALKIPNEVFCVPAQVGSTQALVEHKRTLLYFSGGYNFGYNPQNKGQSLSLYALGRIFEQSITELEILEASAEGRKSINLLSKRKRDGVYYTPEWVTSYIVENTVGFKLDEYRKEHGYLAAPDYSQDDIDAYHQSTIDKRKKAPKSISMYLSFLETYEEYLSELKILDPACGSGAFLIQAFDRIYQEYQWINSERLRVAKNPTLGSTDAYIKSILTNNLYGVDINPESVEITKLALWLHTVRPQTPLSDLDKNIRCGNSLVSQNFYYDPNRTEAKQNKLDFQHDITEFDEATKERINAFDWEVEFQEIFAQGGFDCVIGNPPYVKLQHFRKAESAMAEYLVQAKHMDGSPLYESTQTGNFDLYLPFIERSISLLNSTGKMGFIAPNVWLKNEYGAGLRTHVIEQRSLDQWIDFGSYQVFQEATTYTALQFFSRNRKEAVQYYAARDGEISSIEWGKNNSRINYSELPADGSPLYLVTEQEKQLMRKMESNGYRLDNPKWTKQIMQGLVTSADDIYHLRKIAPNTYVQKPKGKKEQTVEIEDDIMHLLVSGPHVKRYIEPKTDIYLLFPYEVTEQEAHLIEAAKMETSFPKAWKHLKNHEDRLRGRESGKMDHDKWYGYVYPKNLDKQETIKILVPRLCEKLHVSYDSQAKYYIDNVDVNGIIVDEETGWYLTGLLNSEVVNTYWRLISKPFRGDFFSANKQFIAPIPIPDATEEDKQEIIKLSKEMQKLKTEYAHIEQDIDKRLSSRQAKASKYSRDWIIGTKDKEEQQNFFEQLELSLYTNGPLTAHLANGELSLQLNGVTILDEVFVDKTEAEFIHAQWRWKTRNITSKTRTNAESLIDEFRTIKTTQNSALTEQVVGADQKLHEIEKEISDTDEEIEDVVLDLYKLDEEQRALVTK